MLGKETFFASQYPPSVNLQRCVGPQIASLNRIVDTGKVETEIGGGIGVLRFTEWIFQRFGVEDPEPDREILDPFARPMENLTIGLPIPFLGVKEASFRYCPRCSHQPAAWGVS